MKGAPYTDMLQRIEAWIETMKDGKAKGYGGMYDPSTGKDTTDEHIAELERNADQHRGWIKIWQDYKAEAKQR